MSEQNHPHLQQNIDALTHFLDSRKPLILVIGEQGAGKSALVAELAKIARHKTHTIYLGSRHDLQPSVLVAALSQHWASKQINKQATLEQQLQQILLGLARHNQSCLLVIDDAEQLPLPILIALAHLTELQRSIAVHLHIILLGKQSLATKINTLREQPFPQITLKPNVEFHLTKTHDLKHTPYTQVDKTRIADVCNQPNTDAPATRPLLYYWQQHGVKSMALVGLLVIGFTMHWYAHRMRHTPKPAMHFPLVKNTIVERTEPTKLVAATSTKAPETVATSYTLQLMGTDNLAALDAFIQRQGIEKYTKTLYTQFHKKRWYVLTYGNYAGKAQAHTAEKNLPKPLQNMHPWVRPIKDLH